MSWVKFAQLCITVLLDLLYHMSQFCRRERVIGTDLTRSSHASLRENTSNAARTSLFTQTKDIDESLTEKTASHSVSFPNQTDDTTIRGN